MANSPLVIQAAVEKGATTKPSKPLTATASSNGAKEEIPQASNGTVHDLAEQMNEEEKRKYVKGRIHPSLPLPLES